jgi:hypothetical protein
VALLAGPKNYREIAGHAADIPQSLLRKLGSEWSWFRLRYKQPSKSTIRSVLTALRCLKRRISDAIYARLRADARKTATAVTAGSGGQMGNDSDSSAAGPHPARQLFGQATSWSTVRDNDQCKPRSNVRGDLG